MDRGIAPYGAPGKLIEASGVSYTSYPFK